MSEIYRKLEIGEFVKEGDFRINNKQIESVVHKRQNHMHHNEHITYFRLIEEEKTQSKEHKYLSWAKENKKGFDDKGEPCTLVGYLFNPIGRIGGFIVTYENGTKKQIKNFHPKLPYRDLTKEEAIKFCFTDRVFYFWNKTDAVIIKGYLRGIDFEKEYPYWDGQNSWKHCSKIRPKEHNE